MTIITQNKTKYKLVNTNKDIKLKPITAKGKHRYCYIGTANPLVIVNSLLPLIAEYLKVDLRTLLAIISDSKHNVLTAKETCMLLDGEPVTKYGSYVSALSLGKWKSEESIKEFQSHRYTTHNARTSMTYNVKHLSDLMVQIVIHLIDTPFEELYRKLVVELDKESFKLLTEDYVKPKRNSESLQAVSDHWFLTLQRNNTPEVERATRTRREWANQTLTFRTKLGYKETEMEKALDALSMLFPTLTGGQLDYVIDRLYQHYIEGKDISVDWNRNIKCSTKGEVGELSCSNSKERLSNNNGSKCGMYGILSSTLYISSPLYLYTLTYNYIQPFFITPTSTYTPLSPYNYNLHPCTTLPLAPSTTKPSPFSTSNLVKAYDYRLQHHPYTIHNYNTLALKLLSSYEPKSDLEKRCKQVMVGTGKAFPLSYLKLSSCPRVYAEGKDNLFYCPTVMRQEICKDLGLKEWDMKSCHTYILLGLYGKSFPVLKKMVNSNSIWKEYEEYFISKECVFNKQVVKAFHYATVLGGGVNAYKHSLKKLVKEGVILTKEETEQYISVYKKHPVVREMKSFINKWGYSTKRVTYPTGETHSIIPPRILLDQNTGKKVRDFTQSNVLQVFSGLLRAWERVLISYVGLSHPEAFTILLHQHDGITVLEDLPNAFDLAQEAMKEISRICFPNLSKPIELEIKL